MLLVAVLTSISPTVVNGLTAAYVIARMAFWIVYYNGIGKVAGGARTLCYIGGLLSNVILAVVCIINVATIGA